jgi:hypothetical protein
MRLPVPGSKYPALLIEHTGLVQDTGVICFCIDIFVINGCIGNMPVFIFCKTGGIKKEYIYG